MKAKYKLVIGDKVEEGEQEVEVGSIEAIRTKE